MLKLALVFLSFISNFFSIEEKYICVNEVLSEEREIIDELKGYKLFKNENNNNHIYEYVLEKDDFKYEIVGVNPKIYFYNNIIYVYSSNLDNINIVNINILTNEINIDTLNIKTSEELFMTLFNDSLIILGTINDDIFIYDLNNKKINYLGGKFNEKLNGVASDSNYLYLSIYKDLISEVPFGNGSEHVIARIDKTYDVVNTIYLNEHSLYKMHLNSNFLYYITDTKIMMFDLDLKYLASKDLNNFKSVFIGKNGLIVVFCSDNNYLLDAFTLANLGEISGEYCKYLIKGFDNKLYAFGETNVYFDVVDLRYLNIHSNCYQEYENLDKVYSLFGKCEDIGREYTEYFNKTIFGHHEGTQEFETINGIAFGINFSYDILPKVNLKERMTYPSGYNILYNGTGKLDGEYIYNNTPVYGEGEHVFVLEGRNQTHEINFYVSDNQIDFSDVYVEEGISIDKDEEYQIKLKLENYENYIIKDIVLDERFKNYIFENGELVITFEPVQDSNNNINNNIIIYFKEIIFLVYGKEYVYNVGKVYLFSVMNKSIEENSIYLNNEYIVNINDSEGSSRALEVEMINNNGSKNYYLPLTSDNIKLDLLNKNNYKINIFLISNNNTNNYLRTKLLELDMKCTNEKNILGTVMISNYENTLKQLKFKFDENIIYKVQNSNSILYEKTSTNEDIIIYYGICFFGAIFLGLLCKKVIKKYFVKKRFM